MCVRGAFGKFGIYALVCSSVFVAGCVSSRSQQVAPTGPTPPGDVEPIDDNSGAYLSPFLRDGELAPWIEEALYRDARPAPPRPSAGDPERPLGRIVGGLTGVSARYKDRDHEEDEEDEQERISDELNFIRSSSDQSFASLSDMATYLHASYADDPQIKEVVAATCRVYPEFEGYWEQAKRDAPVDQSAEVGAVEQDEATTDTNDRSPFAAELDRKMFVEEIEKNNGSTAAGSATNARKREHRARDVEPSN